MGFFKKIFRGVKKVFKKIGRGIKKVVKGVGKFMNKIGIVGQIALMFLPIGPMLSAFMKGFQGVAAGIVGAGVNMGGFLGSVVKGAGLVLQKAHAFAGAVGNTFRTVTDGIKTFVGEFGKTALSKIPGNPFGVTDAAQNFFGTEGAWSRVQSNIVDNASRILDPFKTAVTGTDTTTLKSLSDSTYIPEEKIMEMNPNIDFGATADRKVLDGININLDPNNITPRHIPFDPVREAQIENLSRKALEEAGTTVYSGVDTSKVRSDLYDVDIKNKLEAIDLKYASSNPEAPKFLSEEWIKDANFKRLHSDTPTQLSVGGGDSFLSKVGLGDTTAGGLSRDIAVGSATTLGTQALTAAVAGEPEEPFYGGTVVEAGFAPVAPAAALPQFAFQDMYGYGDNRMRDGMYDTQNTVGVYDSYINRFSPAAIGTA